MTKFEPGTKIQGLFQRIPFHGVVIDNYSNGESFVSIVKSDKPIAEAKPGRGFARTVEMDVSGCSPIIPGKDAQGRKLVTDMKSDEIIKELGALGLRFFTQPKPNKWIFKDASDHPYPVIGFDNLKKMLVDAREGKVLVKWV